MKMKKLEKIYDIVIIGSGPAGLTAAIYAARAQLDAIVLERNPMSGGQILNTYEVDNYPGIPEINGFDLGVKLREHAEKVGARFEMCEVNQVEKEEENYLVKTTKEEYLCRSVILAAGADHRLLGVKGEAELTGHGVSYCATCDGAFFQNKTVAVVGGGDVAVEDAIFLSRMCAKVYVIHRRDEFRAAKILQDQLFSLENVEIHWDTIVDEIKGQEMVEQLCLTNVKTGEKEELSLQGVFIAVGILPNSRAFQELAQISPDGYFIAGEDCRTSQQRIYAIGDIRTKTLRQIVTATADGANAIASLQEDLLQITR